MPTVVDDMLLSDGSDVWLHLCPSKPCPSVHSSILHLRVRGREPNGSRKPEICVPPPRPSGAFIHLRRVAASRDVWREECPSLVSLKCLDACLARVAS